MFSIKFHAAFLTLFGCGKSKYAPGTVGSFAAVFIWLGFSYLFFLWQVSTLVEVVIWLVASLIILIYGSVASNIYSDFLGKEDHSSIVLDEVMGQVIALCLTYPFVKSYYFTDVNLLIIISHVSFCFVIFRVLDITKPSIIGRVDKNVKGGFGVMLDDLICGFLTAALGIGVIFILDKLF